MSILVISDHNSFRVLFDKIASLYFIGEYINILALEMASPGNQHCASCIGTLSAALLLFIQIYAALLAYLTSVPRYLTVLTSAKG